MLKLLLTLFSIFPFFAQASVTSDIISINGFPEEESLHQLLKIGFVEYGKEHSNKLDIDKFRKKADATCNLIIKLFRSMPEDFKKRKRLLIKNQKYIKKFNTQDLEIYNNLALLMMYLETTEIMAEEAHYRETDADNPIDLKLIRTIIEYLDNLISEHVDYPISPELLLIDIDILDSLRHLINKKDLKALEVEEVTLSAPVVTVMEKPAIQKPTLKLKSEPRNIQKVQAPQKKRERHSKKKARR
jgi:hypothetical protein